MDNQSPIEKDKEEEYNPFAINTSEIAKNEYQFWRNWKTIPWKKYPRERSKELESTLQNILVKHCEPTVDYSDAQRDYLLDRYASFEKTIFSEVPFECDYFMITSSKVRDQRDLSVHFGTNKYYYLYSYSETFQVTTANVEDREFELLFAFQLRQCDLMKVESLLNYQLIANFKSDQKYFSKYLKQIIRKSAGELFTQELSDSIEEWIAENQLSQQSLKKTKVKTVLTVEQLAYLFKVLVDSNLLSDENKNAIITMVCENFESKKQAEIKANSFNSKFYSPSMDALEFWIDQFDKLQKRAIYDKQKFER